MVLLDIIHCIHTAFYLEGKGDHHWPAVPLLAHTESSWVHWALHWWVKRNQTIHPSINQSVSQSVIGYYREMLCIRGTSHGPVSVRPSVTSRCSTKTAKRRITQTTPHVTPGSLVFCCQRSPRNSIRVTPYEGAECKWGGSKSATFDKLPTISRKR